MKIGLFFTYDYSLQSWNQVGVLSKELKLYEKLAEIHNVKFIFFTYGDAEDIKILPKNPNFEVFPIYKYFKKYENKFFRLLYSFTIPFRLNKHSHKIDIIQQHQLTGAWVSLIYKYLTKHPYYMRTGYDTFQFAIKQKKNFLYKLFFKFLTFCSLKYANIYSVTSKSDKKFLNDNFNTKNQMLVLRPNWVDGDFVNNIDRLENRILCVGRLEEQKNYEYLINEFANIDKKYQIDIVGEGKLKCHLSNLSNKNKVGINFMGNIKNENLMKLYKNYKYFISTSLYEGNPKTILEAMFSGCTVIASNIPNHSELIMDTVDGYLFDLNKNELKNIFEEIINKDNFEIISRNSYEKVMNMNSLTKISNNYFQDYKKLI